MAAKLLVLSLLGLLAAVQAQTVTGVTFLTTTASGATVPVFSAISTPVFTPTATGASPGAGTVVTIIESGNGQGTAGGTDPAGTFVYTKPLSSVAPTGNLTQVGLGTGSASNLIPDNSNLRRAAGYRTVLDSATLVSALMVGLFGCAGAAWVLV